MVEGVLSGGNLVGEASRQPREILEVGALIGKW